MTKSNARVEKASLGDLQEDQDNARTHNPRNIQMIVDSLQDVGAARSIVLDENNKVLAGNGVLEGAGQAGIEGVIIIDVEGDELVAVRRNNLSPEQKVRLALWDNRANETSTWNPVRLLEIQLTQPDLIDSMFFKQELELLTRKIDWDTQRPEAGAGGDEYEEEETPPTRVKRGEVWGIGDHRLMCGDACDEWDVEALFDGGKSKAEMVWTDPPYGVGIGERNRYLQTIQPFYRRTEDMENDVIDEEDQEAFLTKAFTLTDKYVLPGGAWYVTSPPGPNSLVFGGVLRELGILHQTIIWVKTNATFAPLGQDYHYKHEIMYYGWSEGAAHTYIGGRQQDTVWEIEHPTRSHYHATVKPIELVLRAIRNHLYPNSGKIVYDPFAGYGTTLICAHRAGVRSVVMEISPEYCDSVLARAEAEGIGPIVCLTNKEEQ